MNEKLFLSFMLESVENSIYDNVNIAYYAPKGRKGNLLTSVSFQ